MVSKGDPGFLSWYSDYTASWMNRGLNQAGTRDLFSSPEHPHHLWGPHIIPFIGYWGSFMGVKQSGCEVHHSSPPSTEVKNEWSYTSAPPMSHHVVVDRENYTFFTLKWKMRTFTQQ
jgi:hypothetical protein